MRAGAEHNTKTFLLIRIYVEQEDLLLTEFNFWDKYR